MMACFLSYLHATQVLRDDVKILGESLAWLTFPIQVVPFNQIAPFLPLLPKVELFKFGINLQQWSGMESKGSARSASDFSSFQLYSVEKSFILHFSTAFF